MASYDSSQFMEWLIKETDDTIPLQIQTVTPKRRTLTVEQISYKSALTRSKKTAATVSYSKDISINHSTATPNGIL